MRILKKKIALAAQFKQKQKQNEIQQDQPTKIKIIIENNLPNQPVVKETQEIGQRKQNHKVASSSDNSKSTKTIVKNYGKAIASFAMNKMAKPYLSPLLKQEGLKKSKEFIAHMVSAKESIEGIETFRALLLIKPTDSTREAGYKRVFQKIAEIFIKFFSVNWVFSGKMHNKDAHLKFRFKILRRVRNPEHFTYLK